jgi:hypothetical protein
VAQGQEQMGGEQAAPEAQEAMQQRMREYLNTREMRESVEHRLRTNRTLDRLVEIVTGVESEAPKKAEVAEEAAAPEEEKSDNG